MKKFLFALVLGLGVFGFIKLVKYQPGEAASAVPANTASNSGAVAPVASPTPVSSPNPTVPTATPASNGLKSGTYSGDTVQTGYGPIQIQMTVSSGKITNVTMLQVPSDHMRSYQIAQFSTPTLIQETLTAQSASIDSVSGATYTSEGYIQSLQSALAKAQS